MAMKYSRIGFPWQKGCTFPPLMHKSSFPVNESCPSVPAFVWMIWTNSASSLVSRNIFGALNSMSGLAGSRPIRKDSHRQTMNISQIFLQLSKNFHTNYPMLSSREMRWDHTANVRPQRMTDARHLVGMMSELRQKRVHLREFNTRTIFQKK